MARLGLRVLVASALAVLPKAFVAQGPSAVAGAPGAAARGEAAEGARRGRRWQPPTWNGASWRSRGPKPAPFLQRRAASSPFEGALKLPSDEVVEAVARAGTRVTAADVAAAGGVSLKTAREGLRDLAAALSGLASLEVSKSGELVYVFPQDPKAALSKVSSAAAARQTWNAAKPVLFTGLRIAFGVALFASIAVIYSALIVLSSSSSDRDRDDRRSSSFGGGGGGGFGFGFGPTLYYGPSPFDLFFYRPYYSYGGYGYGEVGEEARPKMGFLEAVYSFVFGDGDPNDGRDARALAAVAAVARRSGGVVTAEQLAPLLSPPERRTAADTSIVDESWVLPAVTRLNGRPEVTSGGEIVYVFDDLQTTAGDIRKEEKPPSIIKEQRIPFSLADDGQLTFAGLLGAANLFGAGYLGTLLAKLPAGAILPGWLGSVQFFYPALLAYAIGFFVAPALRYFNVDKTNNDIDARNANREKWLSVLQSGDTDGKLAQARSFRTTMRQVGSGDDSVYSTGKAAAVQGTKNDLDDFDRRLGS